MNLNQNKMLCFLIIITVSNDTAPWPIFKSGHDYGEQYIPISVLNDTRFQRQVVQPKWLNFGQEPVVDPTVEINEQSLKEAEEIRSTIQKAVANGTFAVDDKHQTTKVSMQPLSTTASPRELKDNNPTNGFRNWFSRMRQFWRGWAQNLFKRV